MKRIKDKTLLLLSLVGAVVFLLLKFVKVKPNRISQGTGYSSFEFLGNLAILILFFWLLLVALSFCDNKRKNFFVFIVNLLLLLSLFWVLQISMAKYIEPNSSARISLSSGFYVQIFSIYMIFTTYTSKIKKYKLIKILFFLLIFLAMSFFISSGKFNDLSLIKEYTIKKSQFYNNLRIHALLTFFSVATGIFIAVPLGFLAYSKKRFENKVMIPLSIIETIPSLSLFGILLVPLANLGRMSFFDAIGVSGIGWAPAYVALTLYTLLPIGRNTLTGFYSVEKNIKEAAKGMGMSRLQILKKIELPLAFPVIFTGIRIAFIQTIGGAVLAGLVGGGGMGTFVFLGLGEASPDLILLGVLPIVFFTVLLDYILKVIEKTVKGVIYD
ncbi:MAG: ABC transporter permease [Bacillota bacterium]|nr:ABC transporter permease [Bacillota bacterium]